MGEVHLPGKKVVGFHPGCVEKREESLAFGDGIMVLPEYRGGEAPRRLSVGRTLSTPAGDAV